MIAPSSGIPNSLDDTEFMTKKNTPSAEKKTNWCFFIDRCSSWYTCYCTQYCGVMGCF